MPTFQLDMAQVALLKEILTASKENMEENLKELEVLLEIGLGLAKASKSLKSMSESAQDFLGYEQAMRNKLNEYQVKIDRVSELIQKFQVEI